MGFLDRYVSGEVMNKKEQEGRRLDYKVALFAMLRVSMRKIAAASDVITP